MSDAHSPLNLIDLSLDAALQLEELAQGKRSDAPTFQTLVDALKTPRRSYSGSSGVSMLTDVRNAPLLRKAINNRTPKDASLFFDELVKNVATKDRQYVELAKTLCLMINNNLLTKDYDILVRRHPRLRQHVRLDNAS